MTIKINFVNLSSKVLQACPIHVITDINDDTERRDTKPIKPVLTFQAVFLDFAILCLVPGGLLERDIV